MVAGFFSFANLISRAAYNVAYASRDLSLGEKLTQTERRHRRKFAWLQDHGASSEHGSGNLGYDLVEWDVPRRDRPDDADRFCGDDTVPDPVILGRRQISEGGERSEWESDLHYPTSGNVYPWKWDDAENGFMDLTD